MNIEIIYDNSNLSIEEILEQYLDIYLKEDYFE